MEYLHQCPECGTDASLRPNAPGLRYGVYADGTIKVRCTWCGWQNQPGQSR